jgi:hypothetical protein
MARLWRKLREINEMLKIIIKVIDIILVVIIFVASILLLFNPNPTIKDIANIVALLTIKVMDMYNTVEKIDEKTNRND